MSEDKKPSNEFRIGFKSNPKEVITQCVNILKDDKIKEVHLSAISTSIAEISIISEILKSIFPNLSKKSVFSVVAPFSKKKERTEEYKNRLYPKLEIILTMGEKKEDSATKITEEEIKLLIDTYEKQKETFRKSRKSSKPTRRNRRWRNYSRNLRYSYSGKRTNFNSNRTVYNNRRPFGKSPIRGGKNVYKAKESRKISGNNEDTSVKN